MTDFLDCIRPAPQAQIMCDADGCSARIAISNYTTDVAADTHARSEGWLVRVGSSRSYHHCPRHRGESK